MSRSRPSQDRHAEETFPDTGRASQALDALTRRQMQKWLLEVKTELGLTVLMSTHDIYRPVSFQTWSTSCLPGRQGGGPHRTSTAGRDKALRYDSEGPGADE